MKYWKSGRYGLALSSALALGALPAFGQEKAANTTATNDDEVVELSPFVVETSKDVGYVATNSISGTRLNMAIKDVPMNLEVITSKFIQDTGATNLRDSLRYSAGIVLQSQNDAFDNSGTGDFTIGYAGSSSGGANIPETSTRTAGDSTTKMRGTENSYTLQDGFHRVFSADSINIERVEVLRGPSSLLYGSGCAGGVVNFITKKAIFDRDMVHLGASYGSNNFYRGEFDVNMPLVSENSSLAKYKPAFRVTGAYEHSEDDTEYYNQEHWQTNLMFSFKPLQDTTINLAAEFGYKSEYGNGFQNVRASEGSAGRNAAWVTDIRTYNEETDLVDSERNPDIDYRTFRWSGKDCYTKGPFQNLTVDLEQKFGDNAYFKFGYSHSRAKFETRQIVTNVYQNGVIGLYDSDDPTVSSSGESAYTYTSVWTGTKYTARGGNYDATTQLYTGGLYSEYTGGGSFEDSEDADGAPTTYNSGVLGYYWQNTVQTVDRDQLRAEFMYNLDLDRWGNHTFIVGSSYEKVHTKWELYQPPYTWTETYYDDQGRVVSDTSSSHQVQLYDQYSFKNITDYSAFTYGTQGDGTPDNPQVHWSDTIENDWDLAYYACYQGQFFNDKLTIVGGLRWDRTDFNKTTSYPYANSLIGGTDPYGKAVTMGRVDVVYDTDGSPNTATSPQFGVSYAVTNWLTVFGVYSSGTMPNYWALDGNGQMLDPEKTTDYEAGIKFDLFDGKLSGTVSVYRLERENIPYFVWWAPNPIGDVYNGYIDSLPTSMLWSYCTPDAWYDMFAYSGLDYDTCLSTIKSVFPKCWWSAIDEVYNYAKNNSITSENAYTNHNTWTWGDFGSICSSLSDWSVFSQADANTNAADATVANAGGDDYYYFPLVRLTDDNVAALLASKMYSTTWTGNLYTNNNGQHYLYYDSSTDSAILGVNNTGGGNSAFVPMSDKSNGWDMQLTWTPFPELQVMANFSHLQRKVTSKRYVFVDAKYSPGAKWFDDYATLDDTLTAMDVYGDINDASTYYLDADGNLVHTLPMYGSSTDDSPENAFSIWARYELSHMSDSLKGWAVGLGSQWEDNREWFNGFMSGGNTAYYTDANDNPIIISKWTEERITVNGMVEYKTKLADKYDLRFALNVDNILDDQECYGNIYASGRNIRISTSIDF